jgi:predicted Zn-dependent peptidase
MRISPALIAILTLGCVPKTQAPVDNSWRATTPEPLAPRAFQLPEAQTATLSNGIEVSVVENHEMPLVNVRLAFDQGGWTDKDHVGLASVTLDMLNEGAGDYDAAGISKATKALAANIGCGAGDDSASVSLNVLAKNMEPGLDLLATVMLEPTFEQDDWDIMKMDRIAGLASARNNPSSMAGRAKDRLQYGDTYKGMLKTEEDYESMTTEMMRDWWSTHLTPGNARIYVGGDTSLEAVMPMLEARFGAWTGAASDAAKPSSVAANVDQTTIFLVDKPGAPQSVINAFRRLDISPTSDAWFDTYMANMMFGGMFSARLNLNLREEKGWTYGARSGVRSDYTRGTWTASTSVKTDTTADSISEILREVSEAKTTRPFTAEELENASGYLLGSRPVRYENAGTLLGELQGNWLYGLPDDWITAYADNIRAVTLEGAQAAWTEHIQAAEISILVVGDKATILEGLQGLGLTIVYLDSDGESL